VLAGLKIHRKEASLQQVLGKGVTRLNKRKGEALVSE